jgi:hypothetical protein
MFHMGAPRGGRYSRPWALCFRDAGRRFPPSIGDFACRLGFQLLRSDPIGDSHLHLVRSPVLAGGGRPGGGAIDLVADEVTIFRFPPGLEDLHIERRTADDRCMWMVTEFGTRRVLATRLLEYLLR